MIALLLATLVPISQPVAADVAPPPRPVNPFARWEKNIAAIEQQLAKNPPQPGAVFFSGSSSIVKWDLKKWFPNAGYVNVGFGGSVIADSTHFAPRILTPFKPGTVVFYAGDNDIGRGYKSERVLADFQEFVATLRKDNPSCRVVFLPVKPSLARWKLYDEQTKANGLVRAFCDKTSGLKYVDVVTPMLGTDGTPIPELFVKDGLHMSDKGYELWTAIVNKALEK